VAGLRFFFEKLRSSIHLRAMARLDAVTAPSRFVAALAAECGLGNIVVVPASIPLVTAVPRSDVTSPVVAYVGRLEPEKGVTELIDEFSSALTQLPDIQLVIAGTGSCESRIRDRIQRNGCGSSVRLLGHVDQDEVDSLFARASVAVA
jgi:glycosyltransferase involved in cell wall biosynthesis